MIETIMIFAAGFLVAALLALLIIPAINRRAERLARRRVEALFPLSITELTAEKDHLRAEFAVQERRLERKAEEALASKQQDMEELGRRAVRIEELSSELAARDAAIAGLEGDLAATRQRLASTEEDLAATRASLAGTRDTLAAMNGAHAKTLDELAATRAELAATQTNLAETRTALADTQERLRQQQAEHADLSARHNETLGDLDAKRIAIADLETRLLTQTARGDEFERALGERRSELSDERQRLADLARNLLAEQERGQALEQRIRGIETERDARSAEAAALRDDLAEARTAQETLRLTAEERQTTLTAIERDLHDARERIASLEQKGGSDGAAHASELRSLAERLDLATAEKASLEGALAAARDERTRLDKELQALRGSPEPGSERIRLENADLRRRIDEVAEKIMTKANGAAPAGTTHETDAEAAAGPS